MVNGQIILKKKVAQDDKIDTYFGRFGITHRNLGLKMQVSTQDIVVFHGGKRVKLQWSDNASLKNTKWVTLLAFNQATVFVYIQLNVFCPSSSMDLKVTKNCSLTVTLRHSVKFMVVRHTKVWKRRHFQQHYLGFYTLDSHHLSTSVGGLLGRNSWT